MSKRRRRLRKAVKSVGRAVGRYGSIAAPIVGGLALGPAGAAGGTALGAGLSRIGTKRGRRARLRRTLVAGGASIAGTGAIALLGGGGIAESPFSTLFGGRRGGSGIPGMVTEQDLSRELAAGGGGGIPGLVTEQDLARQLAAGGGGGGIPGLVTEQDLARQLAAGGGGGVPGLLSGLGGILGGREAAGEGARGESGPSFFPGGGEGAEDRRIFGMPPLVAAGAALVLVLVLARGRRTS